MNKEVVIIGYSGHAYVAHDIITRMGQMVVGYCDKEEKNENPMRLKYFGDESEDKVLEELKGYDCFIGIGDSELRRKIFMRLKNNGVNLINAIHPSACIAPNAQLGRGIIVGPGAIVNEFAELGDGVICNSGSIVEHECKVGAFSHIAPGAVLGGNVNVGNNSLIGSAAVVLLGLSVGEYVTVGAGAVVINDVPDNTRVVGNPAIVR